MKKRNSPNIRKYLIYISIIGGIIVGHFFPKFSLLIYPWGKLYISFLKMSIIPIIITGIISTVGNFFQKKQFLKKISFFFFIFISAFCIVSAFAITVGLITQPGKRISLDTKVKIGQYIAKVESSDTSALLVEKQITIKEEKKEETIGVMNLLVELIPTNIFRAVNEEKMLKIVFFSFILGIALVFVPGNLSKIIISGTMGLYQAFRQVIRWMMIILPFGLFCLLAGNVAYVGSTLLAQLGIFILIFYISVILLILLNTLVLSLRLKISFGKCLLGLKETILVAFGSKNSFIALPFAIKALTKDFKLKDEAINLLPLSFSLFGFGLLFIFSYSTIFFAQLYDISLPLSSILYIFIASILTILTTASMPEYIDYALLAFIFEPLALPLKPAVIILYAIHPLLEPFAATLSVHTNCTISALLSEKKNTLFIG